jgi:tetratricopeptide (TPR) repeat protein
MNTRSTTRQNRIVSSPNRSTDAPAPASSRPVYRVQKRWHSRQRPFHTVESYSNSQNHTSEVSTTYSDQLLRQQALAEAQQENHEQAIELFTQLIQRHPDSATDYNNRGLVYFQSGEREAAIADYNRALQINPSLGSIYNNRANYYAAEGQLLDAILDYSTAIEIDPNNIRAWINQGITFRDLRMYGRAIECFDLALMLHRLEGHVYAERGRAYHLQGDWNCAIADYQRAIDRLPLPISGTDPSVRLRLQVELWFDDLLSPVEF